VLNNERKNPEFKNTIFKAYQQCTSIKERSFEHYQPKIITGDILKKFW